MAEEAKFPGLGICPDGKIRLNNSPPYLFKCEGKEVTDAAVVAFDDEMNRQRAKRN